MKLYGRYASPYVRRVAVTLNHLGLPYEHVVISPVTDPEGVRRINPLGKVPLLRLDDGIDLVDSTAILDYVLSDLRPDAQLLPASGTTRRDILQQCVIATTVLEKTIYGIYETSKRPEEKYHLPVRDDMHVQVRNGLAMLQARATGQGPWLSGTHMTLADITAASMWAFLQRVTPALSDAQAFPALERLAGHCAALPIFRACTPEV